MNKTQAPERAGYQRKISNCEPLKRHQNNADRVETTSASLQGSCLLVNTESCNSIVLQEASESNWYVKKVFKNWRAESEPKSCWVVLFLFILPCNILTGIEIAMFSIYYVAYAEHFTDSSRMVLGLIYSLKMSTLAFVGNKPQYIPNILIQYEFHQILSKYCYQ